MDISFIPTAYFLSLSFFSGSHCGNSLVVQQWSFGACPRVNALPTPWGKAAIRIAGELRGRGIRLQGAAE